MLNNGARHDAVQLRLQIALLSVTLLLTSLGCVTLLGRAPIATPEATVPLLTTAPTQITSCPAIAAILKSNSDAPTVDIGSPGIAHAAPRSSRNETYLTTYAVSGDTIDQPHNEEVPPALIGLQRDAAEHQRIWNYFAAIIPAEDRLFLSQFSVMTDGPGDTLAAVAQTDTDPYRWALEVDVADSRDYGIFTFTLVHEFAHLLTLNSAQVPPDKAVFNNPDDNSIYQREAAACSTYFPGEGCSIAKSYINSFFDQFWASLYREWNKINLIEQDDAYYQHLEAFYSKYKDRFVSEYAVTNPEEDIAESFADFVFSERPSGATIAETKLLFFYQYPELVDLRTRLRGNVCEAYPK